MMTPPSFDPAQQARALIGQGRADQALALIAPLAGRAGAPSAVLSAHADTLKALGRLEDAVEAARRAADASPTVMAWRHNLAAMLGDAGRHAQAEIEARAAFGMGGDAPETWMVLGRALQGQDRFDEAEAAYRQALKHRPGYPDALKELSQLIWMRTADLAAAIAPLDEAIRAFPTQQILRVIKARTIDYCGDPRAAYAAMTAGPLDPLGHLTAAQSAIHFDPALALRHTQEAGRTGGHGATPVRLCMAECLLALSRPAEALSQIEPLRLATPNDQYVIALQATALRMLGDPAYGALYDYDAFVRPTTIDTPEGWPDLPTYLAELAVVLRGMHGLKTHPVGQSLRHGSQTTAPLTRNDHPVIRAFFQAIDGPIRRHIQALGQGSDPVRSRNTGAYAIAGSWSVCLRPNGFHADHVHPQGWLSSACYIDLPRAVSDGGREGWIKFGEPAVRADPPLAPEHVVQPAPGTLVLFPSYMWHGTIPFSGDETRLTIAFDVIPA
jgi:Flp pilus assembly protein TadD